MRRSVMVLVVLCLLLTSCGLAPASSDPLPAPTDELVVYIPPSMYKNETVQKAVMMFESWYPEVTLTVKDFGAGYEQYAVPGGVQSFTIYGVEEEYADILAAELNAGHGPDLILFNDGVLKDVYKSMKAGVFCDLNPLFETDESFSFDDYLPVFDCGIWQGKRYYVPLSYYTGAVVATREGLDAAGLTLPDEPDFAALDACLREYLRENDPAKLFTDTFYPMAWLRFAGLRALDYETGEVLVGTEEFRAVIEQVKLLYACINNSDGNIVSTTGGVDTLRAGARLLKQSFCASMEDLDIIRALDETQQPLYMLMPTVDGGAPVATTPYCVGIRANSPNRANAYTFLKLLLSDMAQKEIAMPVKRTAFQTYATKPQRYTTSTDPYGNAYRALTEEEIDRYSAAFAAAVPAPDYDYNVLSLVIQYMTPYWEGHANYEDCAAQLENYLELYVYE